MHRVLETLHERFPEAVLSPAPGNVVGCLDQVAREDLEGKSIREVRRDGRMWRSG